MDLCTRYSHLWGGFVVFFRKRLTIQEALSHPWITVSLNRHTMSKAGVMFSLLLVC